MTTTRSFRVLAALLAVGALILPLVPAQAAATTAETKASTSASLIAPQFTFDREHADDEIVQLNSLHITSIRVINYITPPGPSGVVMELTATPSNIGGCVQFDSLQSSRAVACMLLPQPYSIRVTGETILLLRHRSRATVSDFAVGDHINVYGFRDSDSNGIDALIVRDLDKPAAERFIQLNNVQVVYPPTNTVPPATFGVVQGLDPCYGYGIGNVRSIMPCPLGAKSFSGTALPQAAASETSIAEPPRSGYGKYVVNVTASTLLLDTNRNFIRLGGIMHRDRVNIYGKLMSDGVTIQAAIVRDLSIPRTVKPVERIQVKVSTDRLAYEVGAPITVHVTAENPTNMTQTLQFTNGCQASYAIPPYFDVRAVQLCIAALTSVTLPPLSSKTWTFTHDDDLPVGMQTLVGRVDGYGEAKASFSVFSPDDRRPTALRVLNPNGGEAWERGSMERILWRGGSDATRVSISLSSYMQPCADRVCPMYFPRPYTLAESTLNDGSFDWMVGRSAEGGEVTIDIPAGTYLVQISGVNSHAAVDSSDAPFTIE